MGDGYGEPYWMLMIRSPGSAVMTSTLPQAGHFDFTLLARPRPFAGNGSVTTVRMRCVPHFVQVQPDDIALSIGA
jgi:hypothetical protein